MHAPDRAEFDECISHCAAASTSASLYENNRAIAHRLDPLKLLSRPQRVAGAEELMVDTPSRMPINGVFGVLQQESQPLTAVTLYCSRRIAGRPAEARGDYGWRA